eukprot:10664337-Prorocentrum_lima.AAC.1
MPRLPVSTRRRGGPPDDDGDSSPGSDRTFYQRGRETHQIPHLGMSPQTPGIAVDLDPLLV